MKLAEVQPTPSRSTSGSRSPQDLPSAADHAVTLPVSLLLWSMIGCCLLAAAMWAAAVALGPWHRAELTSGLTGMSLTLVMSMLGLLVMSPWKRRLAVDWMTMWLGATVFRVLGTPVAAFLLYSAASPWLAIKPFGLSVAVAYLATLFAESAVLALHFRRCFPT